MSSRSSVPHLGVFPGEQKAGSPRDASTPMIMAALGPAAEIGRHPSVHGRMDGLPKCGVYTQWNMIQPQKEGNPPTCRTMEELQDVNAK